MPSVIMVPRFWVFREPCGCFCGSVLADQRHLDGPLLATENMAWLEHLGSRWQVDQAKRAGVTITAQDDIDTDALKCDTHRASRGTTRA